MARMEASNSEIRENMKMIPVLGTKQIVMVKKQNSGLTPWIQPPALIDGSLMVPHPKLISNLKNNIEMEESFQRPSLGAKYHRQRHSVIDEKRPDLILELDTIHKNLQMETPRQRQVSQNKHSTLNKMLK